MPTHRPTRAPRHTAHLRTIRRLEAALKSLRSTEHRAEDALRTRSETILATLSNVPCAILIANNRGRYIAVNKRAVRLTRYTEAELLDMSVWDLTPLPELRRGRQLWRAFLQRGRMRGTYPVRRRNGTLIRAAYIALGNVLPGIHVSALIGPLGRPSRRKAATPSKRRD
jgi:PAS domain S-box-containing protein